MKVTLFTNCRENAKGRKGSTRRGKCERDERGDNAGRGREKQERVQLSSSNPNVVF